MEDGRTARFGLFEFDLHALELRRAGHPVRLGPQPARALAALLRAGGDIVSRDDLAKQVWDDGTFVDFDQGLNFCIRQIRSALGDQAENPQFIETLPRRGYRFLAPVDWPARVARAAPVPTLPALAASDPVLRESDGHQPARGHRMRWLAAAGLLAIVIGSLVALAAWPRGASPPTAAHATVAVLPFDDLSGGETYFADGISEELATQLGRVDAALTVIGRTSMRPFRDSPKTAREIGAEVGAAHLVDGSVRRAGNRVRVTAELIRVADQTRIWSDAYEADATEILSVQQQMGLAIARQVLARVNPPAGSNARPVDSAVYDLYLQGRFYWSRRDGGRAQEKFAETIRRDPAFARGYAGLGDCLMTAGSFDGALEHANRALALDPKLAEALVTRAHALLHLFRWNDAEAAFIEALAIDPSLPEGRYFHAEYLVAQGRKAEAMKEAAVALTVDPLSAITTHAAGVIMYYAGDYDAARTHLLRARELDPSHRWTDVRLALLAERNHAYAEAMAAFDGVGRPLRGAFAYARGGQAAQARSIIAAALAAAEFSDSYHMAAAYVGLGDEPEAIRWLRTALREHHYDAIYTAIDPRLAPLRARTDFRALLAEAGWPTNPRTAGIDRR